MGYIKMKAKFQSTCAHCGSPINVGDEILYYPTGRKAYGTKCHEFKQTPEQKAQAQAKRAQYNQAAKIAKLEAKLAQLKTA